MGRIVEEIYRFLTEWPELNRYTLISMALGFSGLLFNLDRIRKATKEGEKRQQQALDELKQRILNRMNEPRLLTTDSIRSLARAIEKKNECAVITDAMISEVIRETALELEDRFKGPSLVRRLELLNAPLKETDPNSSTLLSLAVVDRLFAYRESQPFAVRVFFAAFLLTSFPLLYIKSSLFFYVLLTVNLCFLTFELLLVFSAIRAELYWKYDSAHNKQVTSWFLRWIRPKRPNPILDFFLLAMLSSEQWASRFWHLYWAPLWESKYFFRNSPHRFATMHSFRFGLAAELCQRLLRLQRDIDICNIKEIPIKQAYIRDFAFICRRLYVVTGKEYFREIESKGEIDSRTYEKIRSLHLC